MGHHDHQRTQLSPMRPKLSLGQIQSAPKVASLVPLDFEACIRIDSEACAGELPGVLYHRQGEISHQIFGCENGAGAPSGS
jgi:hypothetical protein